MALEQTAGAGANRIALARVIDGDLVIRPRQHAEGFIHGIRRYPGMEPLKRLTKPMLDDDRSVVLSLGDGHVGAESRLVTQTGHELSSFGIDR